MSAKRYKTPDGEYDPELLDNVMGYIIQSKIERDGLTPTQAEIRDKFDLPSTSTSATILAILQAQGRITPIVRNDRTTGYVVPGGRWVYVNPEGQ